MLRREIEKAIPKNTHQQAFCLQKDSPQRLEEHCLENPRQGERQLRKQQPCWARQAPPRAVLQLELLRAQWP